MSKFFADYTNNYNKTLKNFFIISVIYFVLKYNYSELRNFLQTNSNDKFFPNFTERGSPAVAEGGAGVQVVEPAERSAGLGRRRGPTPGSQS